LKLFSMKTWEPLALKRSPAFPCPKGILEFGTQAHFSFQEGGYRHFICLWNNKTPRLTREAALIGNMLMRQSVEANDNAIDLFETVDLRNGEIFSSTTEEIDQDFDRLQQFAREIESELERLVG